MATAAEASITDRAMRSLAASVGEAGRAALTTTGAIRAIGSGLSAMTARLLAPVNAVKAIADSIASFVGLANPVAVRLFTLALRDTMAVLGQALTPILKGVTIYVRQFGDVLAKLMPVVQPLLDVIGQMIASVAQGAVQLWEAAAPFIELFTDVMVTVLKQAALGVAFLQGVLLELIRTLAEIFGLQSKRFDPKADSRGAAVRQTRVDSVEGFADALFKKSLEGIFGGDKAKDPQAFIPEIAAAIREGQKVVKEIAADVSSIYKWFKDKKNQVEKAVDSAKEGVGDAAGLGLFGVFGQIAKMFVK